MNEREDVAWFRRAIDAAEKHGIGRLEHSDAAVITGEKLAELQVAAADGEKYRGLFALAARPDREDGNYTIHVRAEGRYAVLREREVDALQDKAADYDKLSKDLEWMRADRREWIRLHAEVQETNRALQDKARKWEEHERKRDSLASASECANGISELRLNFEHGPETYESLRKHFLQLRAKFGTTDATRIGKMCLPRPRGAMFTPSGEAPSLANINGNTIEITCEPVWIEDWNNPPKYDALTRKQNYAPPQLYGIEVRDGFKLPAPPAQELKLTAEMMQRALERGMSRGGDVGFVPPPMPPSLEMGTGIAAKHTDTTPAGHDPKHEPIAIGLDWDWD